MGGRTKSTTFGLAERKQPGAESTGMSRRKMARFIRLPEPGQLRRTPAALAGNQFVAVEALLAHNHRLDDALRLDGFGQLVERAFVHARARLVFAGLQLRQGELARRFGRRLALARHPRGFFRFTRQRVGNIADRLVDADRDTCIAVADGCLRAG